MNNGYVVFSAFDGIACGREALKRAGVKVDKYYASEIDKYAMQIARKNYPDIQHVGDITKIDENKLPFIDLLIGGSPCQGFSFAGKQLNFEDPRSKLFFDFVRILIAAKKKNPKLLFFLENVVMKKEYQDVISGYLGVEPIMLNSSLVSAQNRKRLYWTNIYGFVMPENKGILLKDILDTDPLEFRYLSEKAISRAKNNTRSRMVTMGDLKFPTLLQNQIKQSTDSICILMKNGLIRWPTRNESERMQTLPENYTLGIGECAAQGALGNGWTVDAVVEFFKHIPPKEPDYSIKLVLC